MHDMSSPPPPAPTACPDSYSRCCKNTARYRNTIISLCLYNHGSWNWRLVSGRVVIRGGSLPVDCLLEKFRENWLDFGNHELQLQRRNKRVEKMQERIDRNGALLPVLLQKKYWHDSAPQQHSYYFEQVTQVQTWVQE